MACIFLISDTHFGHSNVLTFKRLDGSPLRDFKNVDEMDEYMIEKWNSVVRPQDHVYHLGDVAMRKEHIHKLARCNGHKRLVRGNHDIFELKEYVRYFDNIWGTRRIDDLILSHIPLHPESLTRRVTANVHGHTHAMPQGVYGSRYYSVCVEVLDYTPISIEEVKKRILSLPQNRHSEEGQSIWKT